MSLAEIILGLLISVILSGYSSVVGSCYTYEARMGLGIFTAMVFNTNLDHICW